MKISPKVRELYENQYSVNVKLRDRVDTIINAGRHPSWFYFSRLKEELSFAQKLETGRVVDPANVDDFFACTIVVDGLSDIAAALNFVESKFSIVSRRPRSDEFTDKDDSSFVFDDLRLYVRYQDDPDLPPTGFTDVTFEVQIKTFLQHAWGRATHDLIYKADEVNWAKRRIAFQVRALLEHAEISIQEAEALCQNTFIAKDNYSTASLKAIISFLKDSWPAEALPRDLVRLAESVERLLFVTRIDFGRLKAIIETDTAAGAGINVKDLSPYGQILQAVINQDIAAFREGLSRSRPNRAGKYKQIFIPENIAFPDTFKIMDFKKVAITLNKEENRRPQGE